MRCEVVSTAPMSDQSAGCCDKQHHLCVNTGVRMHIRNKKAPTVCMCGRCTTHTVCGWRCLGGTSLTYAITAPHERNPCYCLRVAGSAGGRHRTQCRSASCRLGTAAHPAPGSGQCKRMSYSQHTNKNGCPARLDGCLRELQAADVSSPSPCPAVVSRHPAPPQQLNFRS